MRAFTKTLVMLALGLADSACGRSEHGLAVPSDTGLDQNNGGALDEPRAAGEGGGPDVASSPVVGGTPSDTPAASGGVAAGDASPGTAGAPDDPSLIRAGSRYCQNVAECFGFECVGFAGSDASICSLGCDDDAGCEPGDVCAAAGTSPRLCLQACQGAEDCAYGFDCVKAQDAVTFCLPAPWTEVIMHPR